MSRALRETLLQPSQIIVQAKAIVRIRTARVDKGQHHNLARKLRECDLLPILVGELEIGHYFTRRQRLHLSAGVGNILQDFQPLSFLRLLLRTLETPDSKFVGVGGGVTLDMQYELNHRAGLNTI